MSECQNTIFIHRSAGISGHLNTNSQQQSYVQALNHNVNSHGTNYVRAPKYVHS